MYVCMGRSLSYLIKPEKPYHSDQFGCFAGLLLSVNNTVDYPDACILSRLTEVRYSPEIRRRYTVGDCETSYETSTDSSSVLVLLRYK